jgi:simple sugar transport system permease protein
VAENWGDWKTSWPTLGLALAAGLLGGLIVVALAGGDPGATAAALVHGSFGNGFYFATTLTRTGPVLLVALGLCLALRAEAFNLGAEGQLVWGGLAAALAGSIPGELGLVAAVAAGLAAGAAWAFLAGALRRWAGVDLVLSTLLLNYIAVLGAWYLVSGPFQDGGASGTLPQTARVLSALPPMVSGTSLHAGLFVGPVVAVVLAVIFGWTKAGYRWKMLGLNPRFAETGRFRTSRTVLALTAASGALCGLAGALEVLGVQGRFLHGGLTAPGYAWTGLMAALLAGGDPLRAVVASVFLAGLQTGGMGVERSTSVPFEISTIVQGLLTLFLTARWVWGRRRTRA